jgi:hypothetical protein
VTVYIVWESYCGDPPDIAKIFATQAAADAYVTAQGGTRRNHGLWVEPVEVLQ